MTVSIYKFIYSLQFNFDYFYITWIDFFFFCLIIISISCLLVVVCYLIADHYLYSEKISGYECGFDPFSDARDPFDIKFYLISILFIIFDIELIYFFPWILSLHIIGLNGFYSMYCFFFLLVLSFFYEWKQGCLNFD